MRNILLSFVGLLLLFVNQVAVATTSADKLDNLSANQSGTDAIRVSSTPELTQLATSWVNGFNASQKNYAAVFSGENNQGNVAFATEKNLAAVGSERWSLVVGRDVYVAVFNANNPMTSQLLQTGVSIDKMQKFLKSDKQMNWSDLMANGQPKSVAKLVVNQPDLLNALAAFAETTNLKTTLSAAEMIAALKKDPLAIGFCQLNELKILLGSNLESVKLLPIDKNGNGRLDTFENIYTSLNDFTHGVWIGKYPSALTSDIYATSNTRPTDKNTLAFLAWILENGQSNLTDNGYCNLTSTEKQAGLSAMLISMPTQSNPSQTTSSPFTMPVVWTIVAMLGLFGLFFLVSKRGAEAIVAEKEIQIAPRLIENMVDVPKGLYFDKSHTWAFMETDGHVKVGMDDFLQHITGKLSKIKMKEVGESVRKGEKIVTIIRDGKQLSLYAPISGTIVCQNKQLFNDATLLNSSPYHNGWVYQIEPKNWLREIQFMLMGERYADWLKDEFVRLRDFFAASIKTNELAYAHVILQDGGELTDNVLAEMDPKVWEDFQTRFIDASK